MRSAAQALRDVLRDREVRDFWQELGLKEASVSEDNMSAGSHRGVDTDSLESSDEGMTSDTSGKAVE